VDFGEDAARRYKALLKQATRDIGHDPERHGSKEFPGVLIEGARIYHLESSRNRVRGKRVKTPRHFLLYRRSVDGGVEVGRVLHDACDLARHVPDEYRKPPQSG
jgi:toxin ParE1/3/4